VTPTRSFALLLVVAALGCAALAFTRSDDSMAAASRRPSLDTALWSPRRVPQPLVDAVGAQRLQTELDAAVSVDGVRSCFVVSEGGAPLATHGDDVGLVPASTQKLLTAAAALEIIGPDTTLDTVAVAPQAVQDGTVEKLYLVGGGDPLLMTPDVQALREQIPELRGTPTTSLASLADAIVAAGVERIPKGIAGDDSRYEELRYLPGWDEDYRTEGQVGPLGALTVNGGFRELRPTPIAADDPATFAAEQLGRLLAARGVKVGAPASHEKAPQGAVQIAKVSSPPVSAILYEDLSTSDNLGSELLTREIGARASQQGTTAAGTAAIKAELDKLGLPTKNAVLLDGSGLHKGNRSTCPLLAAVIDLATKPRFAPLLDGLSIAGERGTLVDQLSPALTGKVRAKTGTVDGATALAGIVDVTRPLRFAFIANGALGTERDEIAFRGRIADVIAKFPDAPSADQLVPAPATSPSAAATTGTSGGP
jgi:D-alanyl-D-alanine carboxypeptidase/D-alanyl-D-alanine-endopeptidase (penicillin-binding protein 4)